MHENKLSRLCQYYLKCIESDNGTGIEYPSKSKVIQINFCEIYKNLFEYKNSPQAVAFLNQFHRTGNLLYLGYPLYLRRTSKGVENIPVLLWSIDLETDINTEVPAINTEAVKAMSDASDGAIEESVKLNEEIGLAADSEHQSLPNIIEQLRNKTTNWRWAENPNPFNLSEATETKRIESDGIYNSLLMICQVPK
jgi:hypothetical protein